MVQTRATTKGIESGEIKEGDCRVATLFSVEKKTVPARRRRRGKPGELCQLNLDVLFLIAAYIHPLDLLNLARTCKSLRELLMDKASEFIWKTARRQVEDLPECPDDLTEREYAHLVFYARCHGCGKYAKTVFWSIRRRYCPNCRQERLCPYNTCETWLIREDILAKEFFTIGNEQTFWIDKEQMRSTVEEYNRSTDKDRFLNEKKGQILAVELHAHECTSWEESLAYKRRLDLESRKSDRDASIMSRLKQLGFESELSYFGGNSIRRSNPSLFRRSKPLTEKEWAQIWPGWRETMNDFRFRRLDATVYRPRRGLLIQEYDRYVANPTSASLPAFCLPHVDDLARFPPFQELIRRKEEDPIDDKYESAFAKLPELLDEWKERFDSELAELVEIPPHLSSKSSSKRRAATRARLHLASAVFVASSVCTYPDVLHLMRPTCNVPTKDEDTRVIQDRFNVKFFKDAAYIVHACGLDPNVATGDDMDRRDARLRCLLCNSSFIHGWRSALLHAYYRHFFSEQASSSKSPRWQAMGDEHMDAIRAAELSRLPEKERYGARSRCMLCHPRVGDGARREDTIAHLCVSHNFDREDVQLGVHYMPLGVDELCPVEMVEEEGVVTFKA